MEVCQIHQYYTHLNYVPPKDTQDSFSPKTFSKNIVNRFGIKSQTRGTETVDSLTQTQPVLFTH